MSYLTDQLILNYNYLDGVVFLKHSEQKQKHIGRRGKHHQGYWSSKGRGDLAIIFKTILWLQHQLLHCMNLIYSSKDHLSMCFLLILKILHRYSIPKLHAAQVIFLKIRTGGAALIRKFKTSLKLCSVVR